MSQLRLLAASLVCIVGDVTGSAVASAQEQVWKELGTNAGDCMGRVVAVADDADGDGLADVVVTELDSDCGGTDVGRVVLLKGVDGFEIEDACGSSASLFGFAIDGRLDVDSDGVADFLVGARFDSRNAPGAGAYVIYSGATGMVLREELGTTVGEGLGRSVSSIEDIDGDAARDYVVSAVDPGTAQVVVVYSGLTGNVLHTLLPLAGSAAFGWSLADAGDCNGDGLSDVVVGDLTGDGATIPRSGRVHVFSGANGSLLHDLEGEHSDSEFGRSVDGIGDLNLDGCADFIVGSPQLTEGAFQVGRVYIYSGKDGTLLLSNTGTGSLGTTVSGAGDVNHDGYVDYLAGDPDENNRCSDCGSVRLFSGRTGLSLYHWDGAFGNYIGSAIAGGADLNGDSRIEVIIGRPADDTNGTDAGAVVVYSMRDFYLDADHKQGIPFVDLTLQMSQTAPGNLIGLAVTAIDGTPFFSFLAIAPADGEGAFSVTGQVPPGFGGHNADFQAFAIGFSGKLVASKVENIEFF